jgi:hypothetical protein
VADCEQTIAAACRQQTEVLVQQAPNLTFDVKRANACLSALLASEGTCTVDGSLPWADACSSPPWVGRIALGQRCAFSIECADAGAYCGDDVRAMAASPRAARARRRRRADRDCSAIARRARARRSLRRATHAAAASRAPPARA